MADSPKKYPPTYIRSVAVGLPDTFSFDNLPHNDNKQGNSKPFIGRHDLITKFKKMLESGKGVYLVTGFRGMGKTSFVNKVINEYNDKKKKEQSEWQKCINSKKDILQRIPITIAQSKPTEVDVLRIMVTSLRDKSDSLLRWRLILKKFASFSWKFGAIFSLAIFFLFLIDGTSFHNNTFYEEIKKNSSRPDYLHETTFKEVLYYWFLLCIIITVVGFACHIWKNEFSIHISLWKRLDDLYKRSHATTSFENNESGELSLEMINAKLLQAGGKKTESYPIASAKEIEHELSSIINDFKSKTKLIFVFIFDELDKVEQWGASKEDGSPIFYSFQGADRANTDHLRERRQIIQQIIAGLKNFFTTTEVPFILIAGREMFEASMADISDRQSSVSSIFSYVFYIKSLLNEKIKGSNALSKGIENLLYQLIYPIIYVTDNDNKEPSLYNIDINNYYHVNVESDKSNTSQKPRIEEHVKINMLFQNFIVYLTYRSNGSPKKLIKLIHEFIYVHPKHGREDSELENAIVWRTSHKSFKGAYILFDYAQQQRIGFLSYMYRPFLVKYGSSFKQYSDNMVVSTSFLFDHLLKFHPFAFSNSHLELIPEVLSTNRTPALRDHIKKIIDYLALNHIRETEIGLFDYKFYNRTFNEIYYLSKTFEEESAAFNFTLDESYLIKLHVMSKLKDLRSSHANEQARGGALLSIAYLNGILGDLHFFDQEYDDAIAAYSDVLSTMPPFDLSSNRTIQDFILILKYKLKLGLTFEKVKSFEEALALYSDAVLDIQRFIEAALKTTPELNNNINIWYNQDIIFRKNKINLLSSSLSDIMQIANQAFIANIVLQEKMGVEGITAKKSSINIGGFLNLIINISKKGGFNSTILSNLYLQIGTLLYFKNSVIAFEWNLEDKGHYQYIVNNFMPNDYKEHIDKIIKANEHYAEKVNIYRMPIMAMNMYCLGLKYLLETRINNFELKFDERSKSLNTIAEMFNPASFNKNFNSLGKIHFRYIAIYLSNIGDCMLSMIKHGRPSVGFQLIDMYNVPKEIGIEKENSIDEVFERFKTDDKDIEISPKKVIFYYFLSAYYFEKCSRIRSQSFQLRKILYVLRLMILENFNTKNEDTKSFLDFIETHVVNETLKIASSNVEYSDVHDYNKFIAFWDELKEVQKKKNHNIYTNLESLDSDVKNKIRYNLSNSPDIREPLLLFGHIKLKTIDVEIEIEKEIEKKIKGKTEDMKQAWKERYYKTFYETSYETLFETYDNLIGEHYGISTQYLRLIELTFAVKLHESKIKWKKKQYELDEEKLTDEEKKIIKDKIRLKDLRVKERESIDKERKSIKDKIELREKERELTNEVIEGEESLEKYLKDLEELEEKIELAHREDILKDLLYVKEKKIESIEDKIKLNKLIEKENKRKLTHEEKKIKKDLIEKENTREWTKEEEELKEICVNMLHSLTQIIQIIEVYDNDYLVGHSFMAYYYLKLALLFDFNDEDNSKLNKKVVEEAKKDFLKNYSIEKKAYAIFDYNYTYGMAAMLYNKALKLHSAGDDYKKAISETHYLEDDLNDSSFHFGAAMDRYLMVNDVLTSHMKTAKDKIAKNKGYKFESYSKSK